MRRRRSIKGSADKAMVTSDNYVKHHSLEAVKEELTEANILTPALIENATGSIQFCDTDLNSLLKVRQKQLQGIQLYESVLENVQLEMDDLPENAKEVRTMDVSVCDRIEMPQVLDRCLSGNRVLSNLDRNKQGHICIPVIKRNVKRCWITHAHTHNNPEWQRVTHCSAIDKRK